MSTDIQTMIFLLSVRMKVLTQPAFTYLKLTIETLE